jgi:hypothetical protein
MLLRFATAKIQAKKVNLTFYTPQKHIVLLTEDSTSITDSVLVHGLLTLRCIDVLKQTEHTHVELSLSLNHAIKNLVVIENN